MPASCLPEKPSAPPGTSRQRLRLTLRDAARAFYCQMYYWGRDVLHPDGNLLVRYGFTKIPRTTKEGTSRYQLDWQGGLLELHGFCAGWYAQDGRPGICFDRRHDAWRLWNSPVPPEPDAVQRGACRTSSASLLTTDPAPVLELVSGFAGWLLHYETWARRQWGASARKEQHRDFVKLRSRRWWLPPEESLAWLQALANDPLNAPRPRSLLRIS